MSEQEFQILDGKQLTSLSFQLGLEVLTAGQPDVLLAVWRGGLYPAFCIDEMCRSRRTPVEVIAVQCQRYRGVRDAGEAPEVRALQDLPNNPDRIVIVDDIIDEGRTAQAVQMWAREQRPEATIEIAVVAFNRTRHRYGRPPDHVAIEVENWVVFPHELEGLPVQLLRDKEPLLGTFLDSNPTSDQN